MLDRYGDPIIVSEELKQVIHSMKPLPEKKKKEGLSLLSYSFPGNIIYFGYLNQCYNLEQMEILFSHLHGAYSYWQYADFNDYVDFINSIFDKMGLTEATYQKYKEEYLKGFKKEMLNSYVTFRNLVKEPILYSFDTRKGYAYLDYYFNNFVPFEVYECLSDHHFYNAMLYFEEENKTNTTYKRLETYVRNQYPGEFEESFNKAAFVFKKVFMPVIKKYHFHIDDTNPNQVFIYVEDIKREETDYFNYITDEDQYKIVVYSNNITIMLEIVYNMSMYFLDNEEEFL